ncbi:MAG: Uncharacterized protein G01um101456_440 [Parcubacteria group bacterium Gr01-1014_56]|nr:MAG: Uncharacterized protein G01um101456_440 [Parcubacteria group bacterium Gr01-1014_56]
MTITQSSTRLVALAAGVAVAAALIVGAFAAAPAQAAALTQAQISSIISLLQSFGADQATINNVQASLNGQATPGTGTGSGGACPALTRDLQQGSTGADVMALQKFLNTMTGTIVSLSGAGSPGNETSTFGPATKAAVIKFQTLYNITPIAGYAGAKTRAQIASVCGGVVTPGTPVPTGPGLTVSAAAQPANALAPQGASRIPFTTFTITNNSGAAVVVNNVTVQRTGFGIDANFSGIVLLDQNGLQLGTAKTLNSNHQANVGDAWTLNAGQSMTLTVAGNIATGQTTGGQIVSLQVVAINTSAPVNGSLPINGASHTINTTLTLGSLSTTTSSFDPGAAQTKSIGDTNVRISGIRFTAGSAEDLKLYNIRFRQTGTASASDISNVMVDVNGTKYPTTIDSTGKYYTVVFPGGLMIAKGNSIDVYTVVDISGSNAASRTIKLDIDKVTDVYFVGQLYGYGVAPSGTYTPWFASYTTTINAGTATTIGKANEVAAQNIAVNVSNQPLGGFVTDFKGEAVSVTQIVVNFGYGNTTDDGELFTSISIVDANGVVVSGPVDGVLVAGSQQKATFTDTLTFPTGRQVYTIKGKIPSTVSNGQTVIASTTPSGWTSPTGQTSGNSITLSQGNFSMNTMTVQAAALVASLSTSPSSQNIVAGGQGILFTNLQLDASASGEDIRISALPIRLTGTVADLSSCQLYNGTTILNTGSNVPSSLSSSGTATTFTLDNSLTIAKGAVTTLALKCNVSTAASGTYIWSIASGDTWSSTGVTSGVSVTETFGNLTAGTMTVAAGSLALTVDSSSPSYTVVAGGATGVTAGIFKFRATNEAVNLSKLGMTLANGTYGASSGSGGNGAANLVQVYVYDGATLVGTATFTGTATVSTSTLSSIVSLPKDTDKILTIKTDLAQVGTSQPGGIGNFVKVDPNSSEGSGVSSGTTVKTGATSGVNGFRIFKSYPTLAADTLPSTGGADGRLMRFKVTANAAGPVGIQEFTFTVSSTTGVTVTTVRLKAYTDSAYSSPIGGQATGGQIGSDTGNVISGTAFEISPTTNPVAIPAGTTIWFELTGAVSGMDTGDSLVTTLSGDSAYPTGLTSGYNVGTTTATGEVGGVAANFVWTGNSTTTATVDSVDWSNGYSIPGLPSGGLIQTRSN